MINKFGKNAFCSDILPYKDQIPFWIIFSHLNPDFGSNRIDNCA